MWLGVLVITNVRTLVVYVGSRLELLKLPQPQVSAQQSLGGDLKAPTLT